MKKIKRQQVKEIVANVSPYELSGSSRSIYENLLDTENYHRNKDDTIIYMSWEWECSPYSDAGEFALVVTRLENDKEYKARVKKLMKIKDKEKSIKEKEEQRELEEYLRLKKKFGDSYLHRKFETPTSRPSETRKSLKESKP